MLDHASRPTHAARVLAIAISSLVMTAFAPRAVAAEPRFTWNSSCSTGALQLCASVEVFLAPNPSGSATLLTMRLRNLQGSLGSVAWARGARNRSGATPDQVTPGDSSGELASPSNGALDAWSLEARANGGLGAIIAACDVPVPDRRGTHLRDGFVRACGGAGWVEFSFNLQGYWPVPDAAQLQQDNANSGADDPPCETEMGVACAEDPETLPFVMEGIVLAGLVGARWRW